MNPQQPTEPSMPPQPDQPKPVAYDTYGRPLYAHPPTNGTEQQTPTQPQPQNGNGSSPAQSPQPQAAQGNDDQQNTSAADGQSPQVVYMTRARDPHEQDISPETKAKHDESKKRFPHLNLSEGEFVILSVKRHPVGLFSIWGVVAVAVLLIFIGFPLLLSSGAFFADRDLPTNALISGGIMLLLAAVLFVLGGIIATVVYQANRFYLTNESVIQHIQTSLFSKKDQSISLANVEDASYRQQGMLQTLLNYGSIRLSTEGEETTYRFNFVANPRKVIDQLNNAVEAFKNFRPVEESED